VSLLATLAGPSLTHIENENPWALVDKDESLRRGSDIDDIYVDGIARDTW
jgi:hypothetical protein